VSGKKRSEEANGLSARSGAGQAHPKGPGPVSSKLDTGGLTGGDQDQPKNGRESTSESGTWGMGSKGSFLHT
jgi:hypothetical protein